MSRNLVWLARSPFSVERTVFSRRHFLVVALVTVQVVLLDHLLDVQQVTRRPKVLHWLI